jgi:hypothetical protein
MHRPYTPSTDTENAPGSIHQYLLRHSFKPEYTASPPEMHASLDKTKYAKIPAYWERFLFWHILIEMRIDQERKLYLISIYNSASAEQWHPGSPKFL